MIIPRLGYDIRRASTPADPGTTERSLPPPTVTAEDQVRGGDRGNDMTSDTPRDDVRPVARSHSSPSCEFADP
jgi:hypothetical protein